MTDPTSPTTDRTARPTTEHAEEGADERAARVRTRAARYPHAPERVPDRAGRFLGLLDRSRRASA